MTAGYESLFGLTERPFSLTPDPRYYFSSRSHQRAVDTLTAGFRARERFLLVTGDLGVGKTMLCRTLAGQLRQHSRVAFIGNPLISVEAFNRILLADFSLASFEALDALTGTAVVLVDEAHTLPPPLVEHIFALSRRHVDSEYVFRFAFVGHARADDAEQIDLAEIDDRASTRVRLLALGRDECAAYIEHRLTTAGANHTVRFSPRAHEYVFALSGGIPRLVNLLCASALQQAATVGTCRIEAPIVDGAAAELQLLRARPRRFRWFKKRGPA